MARAYLDHASGAPLRPVALHAMLPFLEGHPGDPGRLHAEGRTTRVAVEQAREQVAGLFGARAREVIFTSSGTEAANAAIWGALARAAANDRGRHVVTTAVEQAAVLEACTRGTSDVTAVGVDRAGRFSADAVIDAIRDDTALVTVQVANQEVGTLQTAVPDIVAAARDRDVTVHVDACAAAGHAPIDFETLGADLCSLDGHTWGAPKGSGALLARRGLRVPPFILGGAQERARRAGIENVPAIVGFGAAADELSRDDRLRLEADAARVQCQEITRAATAVDGVLRYGDPDACLPNLVCLGIDGVEAEPILLGLDQHGVAVHSGSACSSELLEPSPVLQAMGVDGERSLRVSVGWSTSADDVAAFVDAFPAVVGNLRALRGG